jgi:hypothetical protein
METIFVTNLQFSHNTRALLLDAGEILKRTASLTSGPTSLVQILLGTENPQLPTEERLAVLVGETGCTLDELIEASPFEYFESLDLLADMIDRGSVQVAMDLTDSHIEEFSEGDPAPGFEEDITAPGLHGGGNPSEPVADPLHGLFELDTPDGEFEDDELAMFADHDSDRSAFGDGHFVGEVRDRVDLTDVLVPSGNMLDRFMEDEPEILEMGSAEGVSHSDGPVATIQMNFSGPRLTNQEALRKLQVVNGVLGHLAIAFDHQSGSGSGQAQVQLLLDGSPAGFSLLYYQVEARRDGTMNLNSIMHNLRRRPPAEHRRLLNTGLLDLIERSLSAACETLDDDTLDSVLESIAGYQQAIGL